MTMQEIKGEDYVVHYNNDSLAVEFKGELALEGPKEYAPINDLLKQVVANGSQLITLDLSKLTFLNSSGISMLTRFALGLQKKQDIQLVVLGSSNIPWQAKSLKNLQKFLSNIRLEFT